MINKFFLGNFKAFGRTQEIPIKPLTLVFGPNSSGKSSIIQGLLLFNEMISKKSLDVTKIDTGQETIDVGEFEQYKHMQKGNECVEFGARWDVDKDDLYSKEFKEGAVEKLNPDAEFLLPFLDDLLADGSFPVTVRLWFGSSEPCYWLIKIGEIIGFRITVNDEKNWFLDWLELKHNMFNDLDKLLRGKKGKSLAGCEHITEPTQETTRAIEFLTNYFLLEHGMVYADENALFCIAECGLDTPMYPKNDTPERFTEDGIPIVEAFDYSEYELFEPLMKHAVKMGVNPDHFMCLTKLIQQSLSFAINSLIAGKKQWDGKVGGIGSVEYIGPLRKIPSREDRFRISDGGQSEEHDPSCWEKLVSEAMKQEIGQESFFNSWLGDEDKLRTPYEIAIHKTKNPAGAESGMLFLKDKRTGAKVGFEDVGVGISQVIPVLLAAFGRVQGKTCCIEQPELHLHPKLQADLMDVFIRSASQEYPICLFENYQSITDEEKHKQIRAGTYPWGGPHFILETHSEALILRLMKRMRQTANGTLPEGMPGVTPENVAILYVEPHEHYSIVHELELAEDGTLLDPWPGGFFEESFEERFGE